MKKIIVPALVLLGGLGLAGTASAQCTFDSTVTASPFTSGSVSTCGKNLSFTPFCSGGNTIAGPGGGVSIFQVNVGTNNTGLTWGVVSSTAGFFPEMALISSTCAAGNACLIDDTNGTQTVGPDSAPTDPLASGPYFLIVAALLGTPTACGDFNFSLAGTLPVKLQSFSID